MAVLKFKVADVKRIAKELDGEHVVKNYLYEQIDDERYWKEGVEPIHNEYGGIDNAKDLIDRAKLPDALWLVKDQGVYLMSCANRELKKGERRDVVYAEGMDPEKDADWYDSARAAVGGDDFGIIIPLAWLDTLLESNPKSRLFKLKITHSAVELIY